MRYIIWKDWGYDQCTVSLLIYVTVLILSIWCLCVLCQLCILGSHWVIIFKGKGKWHWTLNKKSQVVGYLIHFFCYIFLRTREEVTKGEINTLRLFKNNKSRHRNNDKQIKLWKDRCELRYCERLSRLSLYLQLCFSWQKKKQRNVDFGRWHKMEDNKIRLWPRHIERNLCNIWQRNSIRVIKGNHDIKRKP